MTDGQTDGKPQNNAKSANVHSACAQPTNIMYSQPVMLLDISNTWWSLHNNYNIFNYFSRH